MIQSISDWIKYVNSLFIKSGKKDKNDIEKCYWYNHPLLAIDKDNLCNIINKFIITINNGSIDEEINEEMRILEKHEKYKILNSNKKLCQVVSSRIDKNNFNAHFVISPILTIKPSTAEYLFTIPNISLSFYNIINIYINTIGKNFEKNKVYMTYSYHTSCGALCIYKDNDNNNIKYFYSTKKSDIGAISKKTIWHIYFQNFTNFYSYFVNYNGKELILSLETTQYRYIPLHEYCDYSKPVKKYTSEDDFLIKHPKISEEDIKKIEDLNVLKDELVIMFTSNTLGSLKTITK